MFIQNRDLTKFKNYLAVNKINFKIEKKKLLVYLVLMVWKNNKWYDVGLVSPTNGEITIENKNINLFRRDET